MAWVLGIIAVLVVFSLLAWRFDSDQNTTYGAANWCRVWTIFKNKLFRRAGLRVGDFKGRLGVFYDGAHALTFGATGAGKGVSAILPNLLEQRWVFLVDPGGENTAIASKAWKQAGLEFGCINFFGMFADEPWALPAHGFNPLTLLDVNSPTFAADALVFAEMLTPRTGGESGSSSYFKDAAQSAKRAMIVHIKTSEPSERQNIATLYELVNSDAAGWQALLAAMKANPVCGNLVALEANKLERIEAQAPEEFSAIMSTIQQDLSFLADPLMREKLSRGDVDFSVLKGDGENQRGGIISVVLPLEYVESHAAITRLAMACAILELQRTPYAANKVTFLIDEAAALGKILRFPNWLATMRKYGVRFWSIWQNAGQLVHLYEKNWQTIISNCGLLQILSVGDLETAKHIASLIGQSTVATSSTNPRGEVSVSYAARPLLMADELLRLKENRQIVLIGNLWPIVLKKTPYWKRPEFAGRYHRNPYLADGTPAPGLADRLAALWGRFYYGLVWFMAPHPVAALIIVSALALALLKLFGSGGA